jgi:hypothetical protein
MFLEHPLYRRGVGGPKHQLGATLTFSQSSGGFVIVEAPLYEFYMASPVQRLALPIGAA